MTGQTRGRVHLEKIQVGIPDGTYRQIEKVVEADEEWMSVVDFVREAAKEKLERWKREHPLGVAPASRGRS